MSKMGISLVSSYRGAQVFEAIGVSTKVIDECFAGTTTQIQGVGFNEIATESLTRHHMAFGEAVPVEEGKLEDPGYYRDAAVASFTPSLRRCSRASTPSSASKAKTRLASGRTTRST